MLYLLSFIFGSSIGSFVNLVANRLHVAPIVASRSKCLSCGHKLSWLDLIPIVSYAYLQGKCRYCKVSYGSSSLFVEIIYGLAYVALYHVVLLNQTSFALANGWLFYYTLLFIVLGVMALYDRKHMYLPTLFLFFYSLLTLFMLMLRYLHEPNSLLFLGPLVISFPFLVVWIFSKGKALGFGDVVLFLGVGAFFGVAEGLLVILLSVWIGALFGIGIYIQRALGGKKIFSRTEIPFVPFIVFAFLIVLFTGADIFSIASLFTRI